MNLTILDGCMDILRVNCHALLNFLCTVLSCLYVDMCVCVCVCVCMFYYYYYYKVADLCFVGKKTTFEIELVNANYINLFMGSKGGKRGHLSEDQILEA